MYNHSYTLCFTELHKTVISLYDQTNTTSLRGTIVQEAVPMCPSPTVHQSHYIPVPLCTISVGYQPHGLLYPFHTRYSCPVVSLFHLCPICVQVPLCPSLVQLCPSPTMSQSHCDPDPLFPSPSVSQSSPVVSESHCVPVQSSCVRVPLCPSPVPLCPSPTVSQSSPVVSHSHCVPVQSRCVRVPLCPNPVPLCPSPTVSQSRPVVSQSHCVPVTCVPIPVWVFSSFPNQGEVCRTQ